jgi:hypothetical protein
LADESDGNRGAGGGIHGCGRGSAESGHGREK